MKINAKLRKLQKSKDLIHKEHINSMFYLSNWSLCSLCRKNSVERGKYADKWYVKIHCAETKKKKKSHSEKKQ